MDGYSLSVDEPLKPADAKLRIRAILATGTVTWSKKHFAEQAEKRRFTAADALNVLRAGVVQPADFMDGEWRHQVLTGAMGIAIHFESETELRVITGWRIKK